MTSKVIRPTSKGQITIPKVWREKFHTDSFLLQVDARQITITPVSLDVLAAEEVIFDADTDNNGKGISVDEMILLLKKVRHG